MTTMDIENNLKYGLTRSHFSKVSYLHNEVKNQKQYHVEFSTADLYIHSPAAVDNQSEISNQNICVEKNDLIENKDTYICDVTTERSISKFERNEQRETIRDQGVATVAHSYNVDCVHDDVADVSIHKVTTFESKFEEQNAESNHKNENDEDGDDEMSSCELDVTGENESNDECEQSYESEDMIIFSESESEDAYQFPHYTNQLNNEGFESDLSSCYEDKEMVIQIDDNKVVYENFKEGSSNVFTSDNKVSACSKELRNESWSLHDGHSKQENQENIFMDTIYMIKEIESASSFDSEFSSYAESLHEHEMGSGFKIYTNALYDQYSDGDHPVFFQNIQKGSFHGVINPFFEKDTEFSDLEDELNGDTLSY